MNSKDGLILWTLGAAGTLLIYSAVKNNSPAATLKGYFTNTPPVSNTASQTPYIPGPTYGQYIPGPTYAKQLNSNGMDLNATPTSYQHFANNNIPLRGSLPR